MQVEISGSGDRTSKESKTPMDGLYGKKEILRKDFSLGEIAEQECCRKSQKFDLARLAQIPPNISSQLLITEGVYTYCGQTK